MPQMQQNEKPVRPEQKQNQQPGIESAMVPAPESQPRASSAVPKLKNKVALITGGDSGIGRAVALAFAKEGAKLAICYLSEESDANDTLEELNSMDCDAIKLSGDIGDEKVCRELVKKVIATYGRIDILVNNAAEQHPQENFEDISAEQLERTFRTNLFSMFFLTQAALPHLEKGAAIINTTSVTAYRGSSSLVDYSATKGAIVSFTRSLAHALVKRGIRVNAVAPGPIWTPLIPSTFDADKVATFGSDVPLGRAGEPNEVAPSYVFLASHADSSYITGQVLHPNGGEIING
ncbi:SDR family oxidoreductase [Phragmitibacter flavus]|uniref:SDR family oxidoreductase n=1 Tax=Phragmitibacter flavus TaxID=2576071 RepID=A0A5R8KHS0_9BACT|nr:SDR family oxidoreductase [Phragmitibacter flavus]TLD71807.1 SDR family oxidoreductase [Phragmitibacter flavus]